MRVSSPLLTDTTSVPFERGTSFRVFPVHLSPLTVVLSRRIRFSPSVNSGAARISAAERQVNALAASLGASKSDWWPKVFVKGSIGFASHDFDKLANHNSLTYEIAPTLTWNFFQGTQKIQATRLAKAQLDESIRQFNQTVLTSVQEVDNAMSSYKNSIKQIVALREVVNQGKQTLDLSLDLYKQGLTPFQNVLDAQRSLLTYQNQLTQAQGSSLLNLIQLYQSLGGGWNPM